MLLYITGSRSAGAYIPVEQDQQGMVNQKYRIKLMLLKLDPDVRLTGSAGCYITIDPNQLELFYQKNRISMMLYNTEFRSAGAFLLVEPNQHGVI